MKPGPLILLAIAALAASAQSTHPDPPPTDYLAHSVAALDALQSWYVTETGLWKTTNWWNAANAVTVLAEYTRLSGDKHLLPAIANTFERNSDKNFLNDYYDDEGWWALAWIGTYETTHETRYLAMAEKIFADMTTGWDDVCGGGVWWKKDRRYKNAIANELFLSVAARLATVAADPVQRTSFRKWAEREWQWFDSSGMINADGLINDGLDATCGNNHRNTWSYNQGVILGGLTALAADTGDAGLLTRAGSIAVAAISHLTDKDGVLHDTCEPNCGADGVQFKGIFARNLAALNAAAPDRRFKSFLQTNADAIWRNRDGENRIGVVWSDPASTRNAATQISAIDALLAAARASH